MLDVRAQHGVVAALPLQRSHDRVDAFRDVFDDGDFIGRGADQSREFAAHAFEHVEHGLFRAAFVNAVVEIARNRVARAERHEPARRGLEINPFVGAGKFAAYCGKLLERRDGVVHGVPVGYVSRV